MSAQAAPAGSDAPTAVMAAVRPVVVVGAGTMGNGIAQVFAMSGRPVLLLEPMEAALKKGMATIEKSLGKLAEKGVITADQRSEAFARIATREEGFPLSECSIAVEAVPEKIEIKRAVHEMLDQKLPPDAILATNTSSISVTELAAITKRPTRFIGCTS